MEKIIQLQMRPRPPAEPAAREAVATIIIFPGVRYERKAEGESCQPCQPDRRSN